MTSIQTSSLAFVVAAVVLLGAPRLHAGAPETAAQEARHWLHDFGSAYNHHDAARAASFFTADADQRTSSGAFLAGRPEIESFLARFFASNPGATQELSFISARLDDRNLLVVEAAWEITGLPSTRAGFATYVLRQEGKTWLCIAGRSMIPAP